MPPRPRRGARAGLTPAFALGIALIVACTSTGPDVLRGGEVQLRFIVPRDLPLGVSVHRPASGQPPVETRAYLEGESIALGPVVGDRLAVEFDAPQMLVVVVRNPLDKPVRFWVAPHLPTPHESEAALMIRCLCVGLTYEVPAHGAWTRVIEVGIRRRDAVARMVVTHVLTEGDAPSLDIPSPGR